MRYNDAIAAVLLATALIGCEHADPISADDGEATLSSIQTNIFSTNCGVSGCHDGTGTTLPASMDLRAGHAYSSIVGVSSKERPSLDRVKPGDPDNSYLVRKIEGGPDIGGSRMPFGRSPLSQEEIDLIREWIANGAADN